MAHSLPMNLLPAPNLTADSWTESDLAVAKAIA